MAVSFSPVSPTPVEILIFFELWILTYLLGVMTGAVLFDARVIVEIPGDMPTAGLLPRFQLTGGFQPAGFFNGWHTAQSGRLHCFQWAIIWREDEQWPIVQLRPIVQVGKCSNTFFIVLQCGIWQVVLFS